MPATCWPTLLALAERRRGEAGHWTVVVGQSLKRLAVNPIIIALVAGGWFAGVADALAVARTGTARRQSPVCPG
jgi:hypothetical protein